MSTKFQQLKMLRSRSRYDGFNQRRYLSVERAKRWKSSILRILIVFLILYTLLYLILINGMYITNQSHTTSINIKVHRITTWTNHTKNASKQQMAYFPEDEETSTNYSEGIDGYLDYQSYERSIDALEEFDHDFDEEMGGTGKRDKIKSHDKPFFYDHPVLRRIAGKPVFYISAISEQNVHSNISTSFNSSGVLTSFLDHVNVDRSSRRQHSFPGSSFSKDDTSTFLQPKSHYPGSLINGSITINGWEGPNHVKSMYYCCYRYDVDVTSDDVKDKNSNRNKKRKRKSKNKGKQQSPQNGNFLTKSSLIARKNIWNIHKFKIIKASQFICPLVLTEGDDGQKISPSKIALSDKENCKSKKGLNYVNVEQQPSSRRDAIALCPKMVYGNYTAERLIEWFEFNKLMGVDKIMLFTYNVVEDVKVILEHYVQEGLLITKEFDLPVKTHFKRKPGGKNMMAYQDEQVTVFDCIERFRGFRFVAVLDLDEFLVPTGAARYNATWRTMLTKLQKISPNAAGFTFHTNIFTQDWGISNPRGKLYVTKYILRTKTMWDRKKNIIIPERVQRGKVWTHDYTSARGYIQAKVQSKIATIFHYRNCRQYWILRNTCMTRRPKYTDKTMVLIMQKIEKHVIELKNKLLRT